MNKPHLTRDLMTENTVTCTVEDSLGEVRKLMQERKIRHLPVLQPDTGELAGVVTQKTVLYAVLEIANKFGLADIEIREKKRKVASFMESEVQTVAPGTPLSEAGRYFVESKHGCLPVLESGKLVGILTSADFVKLSLQLLDQ